MWPGSGVRRLCDSCNQMRSVGKSKCTHFKQEYMKERRTPLIVKEPQYTSIDQVGEECYQRCTCTIIQCEKTGRLKLARGSRPLKWSCHSGMQRIHHLQPNRKHEGCMH